MTARTDALRRRAAEDLAPFSAVPDHRPRVRSWVVFAMAVILAFFGLIFSRISLDRSAFVLEDLENEIVEEAARLGELRVEVARLQSPDRISTLADEMGLVYPAERIFIEVPAEGPGVVDAEYLWAQLRSSPVAYP